MSDLADAVFRQYQKDLEDGTIDYINKRDSFHSYVDDSYDSSRPGQFDYLLDELREDSMPGSGQAPPSKTPKNTSSSSPSKPPRNRNHAMLIAMAGLAPIAGLAIGGMLGNKSQEETKAQQLAQMKYM